MPTQTGCLKTFTDQVSGTTALRPGWERLMAYVRPGDMVVITELSRMSRSLAHLLEVVRTFDAGDRSGLVAGTHRYRHGHRALFPGNDGAMAQMERELKAERTAAGRAAAKARGRTGGTAADRPGKAGTRADSVSPFPQDRRRRVSHGGDWAPHVVQLPGANPKAGKHRLFTVAQARSIRYDYVLGFYTFRPRPPIWRMAERLLLHPLARGVA